MTYVVKEVFYTIQGEGAHAGHPAVFVRFAGCNLWSGREEDRQRDAAKGVCALWCDTDFRGTDGENGGRYEAAELAAVAADIGRNCGMVVLTGGEPSLQVDDALVLALSDRGFKVHVETNGTKALPPTVDWITLSPKPPAAAVPQRYDEVKVIFGGVGDVEQFAWLAPRAYLQPRWFEDPSKREASVRKCAEYVLHHPRWTMGVQLHKMMGLP